MVSKFDQLGRAVAHACAVGSTGTSTRQVIDEALQAFFVDTRIQKIFWTLAFHYRQQQHLEEIKQRVALMLLQRFLPQFVARNNPTDDIYKYVYTIAMNVTRTLRAQAKDEQISLDDEDTNEEWRLESALVVSDNIEKLDDRLDREAAEAEWQRRMNTHHTTSPAMPEVSFHARAEPFRVPAQPQAQSPAQRRRRLPTPTQGDQAPAVQLQAIRNALGLTAPEFARELNIKHGTLASYIYGRVPTVPDNVLAVAKAMAEDYERKRIDPRVTYLRQASMADIVQGWMNRLSYGREEDVQSQMLATVLNVNKSTLWRWLRPVTHTDKPMRPTIAALQRYDLAVETAAREIELKNRRLT
jgi:DNA-binding transcriptional regulator YiaG